MSDVEHCLNEALAAWGRASQTVDVEERIAWLKRAKDWAVLARQVLDGCEVEAVSLRLAGEAVFERPAVLH